MSVSRNYSGRKVDLCLFPELTDDKAAVDAKFGVAPRAIAGLSALGQNFLRFLLHRQGHYKSDPNFGTNFIDNLTIRNLRFPTDVQHLFLIESTKAVDFINTTAIAAGKPLDEQIKSAKLADLFIGGTSISMTIEIVSRADEKVSLLLPVSWSL